MKNDGAMENVLKNYFAVSPYAFVLLFGSYSNSGEHALSDVDIGIFFKGGVDMKQAGYDAAMLEGKLGKKVDLLILNDLEKKDPLFGFEVLCRHKSITVNDEAAYIRFKTALQLSYLDHKPLIEANQKAFQKRIDSGKIGKRNFV